MEDWPVPALLLKHKGVVNLCTAPQERAPDNASHFPALVMYYSWFHTPSNKPSVEARKSELLVPSWRIPCHSPPPPFIIYCILTCHSYPCWSLQMCPTRSYICLRSWSVYCSVFSFIFFTQVPFGEGLFHFYPQDTSKRRSKRRQQLRQDSRVSIHNTETHQAQP